MRGIRAEEMKVEKQMDEDTQEGPEEETVGQLAASMKQMIAQIEQM